MGNVVLIGFMGCGKTTIGLKLSYRLRQTVIDTDKRIEREENRTISEIFATDGETYFRQKETECLRNLAETATANIISVGGGTPLRKANRRLMRRLGKVVYLQASPETIYNRLKNDTTRPLLQGENPQEKIRELMEQREGYYRRAADVIVNVEGKDFEEILDEIERAVAEGQQERKRG